MKPIECLFLGFVGILGAVNLFGMEKKIYITEEVDAYCREQLAWAAEELKRGFPDYSDLPDGTIIPEENEWKYICGKTDFDKIVQILSDIEKKVGDHQEAYGHFLGRWISSETQNVFPTDENEKFLMKCQEIVRKIIEMPSSDTSPYQGIRRSMLHKEAYFAQRNAQTTKEWLKHRSANTECMLQTLQPILSLISKETEEEIRKLDEEISSYQLPEFVLPDVYIFTGGKFPPLKYVKDKKERAEYQAFLEKLARWKKLYYQQRSAKNTFHFTLRHRIIRYLSELYSYSPDATRELKRLMKKYRLEESLQKDILQAIKIP